MFSSLDLFGTVKTLVMTSRFVFPFKFGKLFSVLIWKFILNWKLFSVYNLILIIIDFVEKGIIYLSVKQIMVNEFVMNRLLKL